MSVCVLTIRDGRDDAHERSLASLGEHLPECAHRVIVDDAAHELGFAGAIRTGWAEVRATGAEWIFHHEADFIFLEPVPVAAMIRVLEADPTIAQVSLKRTPVNPEEIAAGGFVERFPDRYVEERVADATITAHRVCFSTNPSVYRASLCDRGWPQVPQSEGMFTAGLLADGPQTRFAIWGGKFDPPRVEHIGERCGVGY